MTPLNFSFQESHISGAPNLVWVHGFGGNLNIWDKTIPYFHDFNNLSFDYLGHGMSQMPSSPEVTTQETLVAIKGLIREKIKGKTFFIGHSFAGNLLTSIANDYSNSIGLVFLDCSCAISDSARERRQRTGNEWLSADDPKEEIGKFYDSLIGPNVSKQIKEEIKKSLNQCDYHFLAEFYRDFDLIPERPKKEIPAFILEAEHFYAKNPEFTFLKYFPNAKHEILKDEYHFFFYEKPQVYNKKIRGFIENIVGV